MTEPLRSDENLTALGRGGLKVLQKKQGFRFALDAVLLAHFLRPQKPWRALELGCGCGVISLLAQSLWPQLVIDAVEIAPQMADMAARSVALNGLSNITIHHADFKTLPARYNQRYDYIFTNPPYFPLGHGKLSPDPQVALAKHEIGCTLEDTLKHSARFLKSGGKLALVHRAERLTEILARCPTYHLTPQRLRLVHPFAHKPAHLLLLEAQKDSKAALSIAPPLYIYDAPNHYSDEINRYYGDQNDD